jgi:hypothetical protein
MPMPPPEELDSQVLDLQAGRLCHLFTSLVRCRGGWFANHALERTRPVRSDCNRSVPRAGSLSLGRRPQDAP